MKSDTNQLIYKLLVKVLHSGNCKKSISVVLAIFYPSTSIDYYFPERKDAAKFLHLINVWWTTSDSKPRFYSSNQLGNAANPGDI